MNGYLNILKPPGMTSSDVVVYLRKAIKPDKIGHAGTLDPDAAGVLPIMLGKATRLFDYLNFGIKEYIAEFTFGIGTDTLDASGSIVSRDNKILSPKEVIEALPSLTGELEQIPPAVSAVYVDGKRSYQLAREGQSVELQSRSIDVHSFDLLENTGENKYLFKIECSKGTYIRSLCRDLAISLNSCAYISFLLRTKSGYFNIDSSISIDDVLNLHKDDLLSDSVIPMDEPIKYLPRIEIDESDHKRAINGAGLKAPFFFEGVARSYCNDQFIGLCKMMPDGENMSISKVLAE